MAKAKHPKQTAGEVLHLVNQAKGSIDVGELASELMDAFGGPKALATAYYDEFAMSVGIAKTKLLEGVLRVLAHAGDKRPTNLDLTGLTEQDLESALERMLNRRQEVNNAPAPASPA